MITERKKMKAAIAHGNGELTIVVLGAGPVAMGMCFFAKLYGAYPIIAIGRRDEPLSRLRQVGVDFTINNRTEDMNSQIKLMTDKRGVDFVIDTTGDPDLLLGASQFLTKGGKLVPYATGRSFQQCVDCSKGPARWNLVFTGPSEEMAHQYLISLQRMKLLSPAIFYSHRMPFSRLVDGFDLLKKKEASKIVFEMDT